MRRRTKTPYRFVCRQGQLRCRSYSLKDAIAFLYSRHPKAEVLEVYMINGKGEWQRLNPFNWEVLVDQIRENAA